MVMVSEHQHICISIKKSFKEVCQPQKDVTAITADEFLLGDVHRECRVWRGLAQVNMYLVKHNDQAKALPQCVNR